MRIKLAPRTPSAYGYPLLLKQLLHTPLAWSPDQEIVYRDRSRYTYRDLLGRIGRLANGLASLCVSAGETVAVLDWDSHRYLECFFAVPMMGAVLHTVNVRLSQEQLLYTINHAEDDVLLVNSDFLPIVEAVADRFEKPKKLVLLTDERTAPPRSPLPFSAEYEELLARSSPDCDFPDFDEGACATLFYTTGTTGLPKGVCFSHRQLVLHTLAGMAAYGIPRSQGRLHRDDVYMPITPMFHAHAWGVPYMATAMGVKQVYPGRYDPAELLALKAREGVTFSHCVPTILDMVLSHPTAASVDLSGWKVITGGSVLPAPLCKRAMERGIDIWSGFGMSEMCPTACQSQLDTAMLSKDPDGQAEVRCKGGRPVPLVQMRIVDPDLKDLPHDGKVTGEVVYRAPWATQGYLKDAESSEKLWLGGYLHTGDVACIDGTGFVKVSDRLKDVIKTGGEWVSTLDLEAALARHPGVREVAVVGVPDAKWGERPLALVVLGDPRAGPGEEELRAYVREQAEKGVVSRYGVPDRILFVGEIDKTSVGKVDKKVLRERYKARGTDG
ncbi:MAG: fatty acid--CoA ligase [Deltaproteobacteria bacterium]|nr:fatty acid--CoA ligase [Deltaproteobacteria bacterium]